MSPRALTRSATGLTRAPVRAAHLGLGAFFRAHAAWYTAAAGTGGGGWGIDAFTGRSPDAARLLDAQDGLYTLLVRGPGGDEPELVGSVSEAHDGADGAAWLARAADPDLALVTLTVTEYAYRRAADGSLDTTDPAVTADLAALRGPGGPGEALQTVPARLVAGLVARREADSGPIALASCDNLPGNGAALRRVVADLAADLDAEPAFRGLAAWISANVTFPSSMVDRITPATTAADRAAVERLTGWADRSPVVTEPFTEWVLTDEFPAGRPAWERAGATFVDDVRPHEDRKLWLLNGSHSMLAYTAAPLGFATVAQAVADPRVVDWLDDLWDTAVPYLELPGPEVDRYRRALLERYSNASIEHRLAQIAGSGSQKLAVRIVPLLRRHLADGHPAPPPLLRVLGGWLAHLRGVGAPVDDPRAADYVPQAQGDPLSAATRVLRLLAADLADHDEVVRGVAGACVEVEHSAV
jgi:fructuronate reductase